MTATTPHLQQANGQAAKLEFTSHEPVYGQNYDAGFIGFTYTGSNLISRGIAYFTRWSCMHDINVSHALIVSGENECIEAHAQSGVRRAALSNYFNDEHCQIFFRKPRLLTPELANRIIASAAEQLGCRYDHALIAGQVESNILLARLVKLLSGSGYEEAVCRLKDHPDRWICSELVAHCLDQQPEYHNKGVLQRSDATIDPQELFDDDVTFTPWHR